MKGFAYLKSDDDWNLNFQVSGGSNDTLGDDVASHDSTKDVDEDGLDVIVGGDESKRFLHLIGRRSATDVEKVGR